MSSARSVQLAYVRSPRTAAQPRPQTQSGSMLTAASNPDANRCHTTAVIRMDVVVRKVAPLYSQNQHKDGRQQLQVTGKTKQH